MAGPPDIASINAVFRRIAGKMVENPLKALAATLAAVLLAAAGLPGLTVDTSQESWFLEGDATLAAKERFEGIFGKDDPCLVLVRSESLLSPGNLALIRELGEELERETPWADGALSLADFEFIEGTEAGVEILRLVPDDLSGFTREDGLALGRRVLSKEMWRNLLLSDDMTESLIVLRLKPTSPPEAGGPHPDYLIGAKVAEIVGRPKYAPISPVASGIPVIDFEKRGYFGALTPKLIIMSVIVIAAAMAVATRDPKVALVPFLISIAALLAVFGLEGHLGQSLDPMTVFMPVFLTMGMSTCYCVHLVSQFRAALAEAAAPEAPPPGAEADPAATPPAGALRRRAAAEAAGRCGWPLLASALTTMAGLACFVAIPLRPLRWVGLTSAALMGAVWILAWILMPIVLSLGRERRAAGKLAAGKPAPEMPAKAPSRDLLDRALDRLGRRVLARPALSLAVFGLLFALAMIGLAKLEVSFDFRRTYGLDVPYIARLAQVAESKVGALYSYGAAVELPEPDLAKEPEVLRSLRLLSDEIEALPLTRRVTSLADVVEDLNQALNDGDPAFRTIPDTRAAVAQELLLYEGAGGAEGERWVDYDYRRLRLQVEVGDYNSAEAFRNLALIRRRAAELFPGSSVFLTGSLAQFTAAMEHVTWGQVKTFFLALAAVTVVMAAAFRSLRIALVALIPNAIPVLSVSGLMGWLGVPLDVMTVTIVPMLLGLAVDDTIHLVNHGLLAFQRTGSYPESARLAIGAVGRPVALTSVVLALAFSPYLAAKIKVFSRMGALIGLGLLAALAADLFLTPVILRLAKAFGPERPGGPVGGEAAGSAPGADGPDGGGSAIGADGPDGSGSRVGTGDPAGGGSALAPDAEDGPDGPDGRDGRDGQGGTRAAEAAGGPEDASGTGGIAPPEGTG